MKRLLTILGSVIFISANLFAQNSFNGYIYYHNDTTNPIEDVNVKLIDTTGVAIDSCLTDIDGLYEFNNVQNGSYSIESSTDIDPGGIDLVDANLIMWHLLGFYNLSSIQEMASDVDADGVVTWNDYTTITVYYFVYGNPFPSGDWTFETITYVVGNKQKEDPPPIGGSAGGDVDGSFEPGSRPLPDLLLSYHGNISLKEDEVIEIPVKINTHILLNSFGFVFEYPVNHLSIIDVTSDQGIINFNAENGQLRISCANSLKNSFDFFEDVEIIIKVKAANDLNNTYNLNLSLNNESHIVDAKGNRLKDITLSIPNLETRHQKAELYNNYPNPFVAHTSIDYKIPHATYVTIKLYNLSGQEIATLVDRFHNKGEYKINLNSNDFSLNPGKYIYRMNLKESSEFIRSKIMLVL